MKYDWPNHELEEAYTLPSKFYYDEAIFNDEKHKIFYKNWQIICHVSEVAEPSQFVTCDIFEQSVLVVRGSDDILRAFYNVCQHRGTKLVDTKKGQGKKAFTCKYHAWTYKFDGSLMGAPRTERLSNFDKNKFCLKQVKIEEFAGFVFINFNQDALSMKKTYPEAEKLILKHAPDMYSLKLDSEHDFIAPVNWKVVMDNNIESYHLTLSGPAHKELTSMIDFKHYIPRTYQNWWVLHGPSKPDLKKVYGVDIKNQPYQTKDYINTSLFPNVTIYCVPYADYVGTFIMFPLEAEKTLIRFAYCVPDREETDITKAGKEWMNECLGPEDLELNIAVQQGLKSFGFDQGRYMIDEQRSNESEHAVHYFNSLVYKALND